MKKVNAWKQEVFANLENHTIFVIENKDEYQVFLEKEFYAPAFMFGVPKETTTPGETMLMAVNQAEKMSRILFSEE